MAETGNQDSHTIAGQQPARTWTLTGELGASAFLNARSFALEQIVKPNLSFAATTPLTHHLSWGARVSGILSGTGGYQAAGLAGVIRWAPLGHNSDWDPGVSLALGVGINADILHEDLDADGFIAPFGSLALSSYWSVIDQWRLGVVARYTQLSVAELSLGVSYSP